LENIILIDSAAVDEPPLILEQIGL